MHESQQFDPAFDAVAAAPRFHRILLENEHIRVLEVRIEPGTREPFHTHRWQSIFVVLGTPHLRYFIPQSEAALFEIPPELETGVLHLAPEGLHSLENIDARLLHAFRIELKSAPALPMSESSRGPILEVGFRQGPIFFDNSIVQVRSGDDLDAKGPFFAAGIVLRPGDPVPCVWSSETGSDKDLSGSDLTVYFKYSWTTTGLATSAHPGTNLSGSNEF